MTVYVDDQQNPYGRMKLCHMVADSQQELLEMADRIGGDRKWIQCQDTYKEHFDVCLSMRQKAVEAGAVEVTARQLVQKLQEKRSE